MKVVLQSLSLSLSLVLEYKSGVSYYTNACHVKKDENQMKIYERNRVG